MADAATTPYQQAVFAQEQLEKLYESLCKQLWPYRLVVSIFQNALMFRQSHVLYSLVIFVFVHAAFVWYSRTNTGFIGILANLLFLYFLFDLLLYAATYKERKHGNKEKGIVVKPPARFTPMERIMLSVEQPRDATTSFTYEEICFLFAKRWNWLFMFWMALRHWNREDPLVFSCIIGILGVVLILIGWYIPGVVLSYCIIMILLLWPYIEYHQLQSKMFEYLAVAIAKLINVAVRWVTQMKEYAEDDANIGTTVASLDDGFENDLGSSQRPSAVRRKQQTSDSRMDSFFGPPIHAGVDPLQSIVDPSLSNIDLNMSLLPTIKQHDDVDDDATINDAASLSEDYSDNHEENEDNAFPELNFTQQPSGAAVAHEPFNLPGDSINTSTPIDHQVLPRQQESHLPTYDEVINMDSSMPPSSESVTHHYPDESTVTYRYKSTA